MNLTERGLYPYLLMAWIGIAAVVFLLLRFVPAPYGRHARPGWGPALHRTAGWIVMETPAVLVPIVFFAISDRRDNAPATVFLALWLLHYVYRAFIYPWRLTGGHIQMPISVVMMGFLFNAMNGYLQGRYLFTLGPARAIAWFADPRFLCGLLLFLGGHILNRRSDSALRSLRAPGDTGYKISYGGAFRFVSCPNYLGELVEWLGWAVLTWSIPGLVFFLWTAANLVPRARSHHKWYRTRFPDYPPARRAIVPFIY
ncbi:MAG: methyltransferase [Pseudomonadota bacterium]